MDTQKIFLVRSPAELVKHNLAGYGWPQVNFSEASSATELLHSFLEKGIDPGRQRNQIKRFFSISKGDIIVVPLHRAIALGYATGTKDYAHGIGYGENRVGVEYLRHSDGSLVRVPRSHLPEALSTRLRIRMSVVSLGEFKEDVLRIIEQVRTSGGTNFDSHVQALEAEARTDLQKKLLENLQKGNTFLSSGGDGLERLVAELFSTEGYATKVFDKRAHQGTADADVEAFRKDRFSSTKLYIQVKHHIGNTGLHALRQLQDLDTDEDIERWIITTGTVSREMVEEAESQGIGVMDGESFADWLIDQAPQLSPATLNKLGVSSLPSLLL